MSPALFVVFFHAIQPNGIAWMDGLLCDVTAAKQHSTSQKKIEKKRNVKKGSGHVAASTLNDVIAKKEKKKRSFAHLSYVTHTLNTL